MNARLACALAALAGAGLLGFGYYLQHVKGLEPCPLCLVQRAFFYLLIVVFMVRYVSRNWAEVQAGQLRWRHLWQSGLGAQRQ